MWCNRNGAWLTAERCSLLSHARRVESTCRSRKAADVRSDEGRASRQPPVAGPANKHQKGPITLSLNARHHPDPIASCTVLPTCLVHRYGSCLQDLILSTTHSPLSSSRPQHALARRIALFHTSHSLRRYRPPCMATTHKNGLIRWIYPKGVAQKSNSKDWPAKTYMFENYTSSVPR